MKQKKSLILAVWVAAALLLAAAAAFLLLSKNSSARTGEASAAAEAGAQTEESTISAAQEAESTRDTEEVIQTLQRLNEEEKQRQFEFWEQKVTLSLTNARSADREVVQHPAFVRAYEDGSFCPDRGITLAEMACMLYVLLDDTTGERVTYADVDPSASYADAIGLLGAGGILDPEAETIDPEHILTRGEFTEIMARFTPEVQGESDFSDVSPEDYYYIPVSIATVQGWVAGYPDGTFRPEETLTRAQAVTLINRYMGRAADPSAVEDPMYEELYTDVPPDHWAWSDILEASVDHTVQSTDPETWAQ